MAKEGSYLSEEAQQRLPYYQYRGKDCSLLYNYAFSPLADFCVRTLVPKTMAPNTITSLGFVWMVCSYAIYWYYVPTLITTIPQESSYDLDSYPPRWIFLFNAVAMFVYQTLDNMDGKQARRTHSSSPLGMLFDHGCDAVNSTLGSANWIIGMGLIPRENICQVFYLLFGPYALFYISTWEHYYTGELIMPIFNGPNEGLLGGILLSLTSWLCGPQFWQGHQWENALKENFGPSFRFPISLRNCDFVIYFAMVATLNEVVRKSISVAGKYKGAEMGLLPFATLVVCFVVIGYVNLDVWLSSPRNTLHLAMVLFVEMSTELMLAHVTEQPFRPLFRWYLSPLVGLTIFVVAFEGEKLELATSFVLLYLAVSSVALCYKIYTVIQEMCSSLGIWCFDIVSPHPNAGNPNSMQWARKKSKKV